jgi:hypothetical protein
LTERSSIPISHPVHNAQERTQLKNRDITKREIEFGKYGVAVRLSTKERAKTSELKDGFATTIQSSDWTNCFEKQVCAKSLNNTYKYNAMCGCVKAALTEV